MRTIDGQNEERWVDLLITGAGGRKAIWNFEGFSTAEEARAWLLAKTTTA